MTILLFTTTDARSARSDAFGRLLASVAAAEASGVPLRHHILLQNCDPAALKSWETKVPSCCRMSATPGRLSLAAARNRLLGEVLSSTPPGFADVVAFPDDDCWFPDGLLGRINGLFDTSPQLGLLICRFSASPDVSPFDTSAVMPAQPRHVVRLANSGGMFLRGSVVSEAELFDPTLGLGTPAGSGEDTDYAVRAFLNGARAGLIDRALMGHPAPDQESAARYFSGSLQVLGRHARSHPALMREFLRKLLVGVYFMATGKLAVGTYFRALRETARLRARSPGGPKTRRIARPDAQNPTRLDQFY
jgi:hypothetical protein